MVKMKAMKATASNTIQKMKAMKTMKKPASSMTPKKTKALSKSANKKTKAFRESANKLATVECQPGHFPNESASAQANAARRTWSDAHFEIPAGVDRQMPIFGFTLFSGSQ